MISGFSPFPSEDERVMEVAGRILKWAQEVKPQGSSRFRWRLYEGGEAVVVFPDDESSQLRITWDRVYKPLEGGIDYFSAQLLVIYEDRVERFEIGDRGPSEGFVDIHFWKTEYPQWSKNQLEVFLNQLIGGSLLD